MEDIYTPQDSEYNQSEIELENAIEKPNLSSIESKDPSLTDGYKIIYNKEVPIDIKLESKEGRKDLASYEFIRFKLLSDSANKENGPKRVKLELTNENDLLFHYTNIIDEKTFLKVKQQQNLTIDFPEYCDLVQKICENCIQFPDTYICVFIIQKEGISKLQFVKGSEFKFLELLILDFKCSSDEIIQKQMVYRFSLLKSQLDYNKKCIQTTGDVILKINPDVLQPILEESENYKLNINKFFGRKLAEK